MSNAILERMSVARRMRRKTYFAYGAAFFLAALFIGGAFALPLGVEGGGLVPNCPVFRADGTLERDCQLCDFEELISNLIRFAILTLAAPLSALLFGYAGILYITAGGDQGKVKKAHSIFSSVLIGFVIALGAWIAVDTIMKALVSDSFFKDFGPWNDIKCVPYTAAIPVKVQCPDEATEHYVDGENVCDPAFAARVYPPEGQALHPEARIGTCTALSAAPYAALINQEATARGLSPELVRAYVATESSFNPNAVSGSNAHGLMQLLPSTARSTGLSEFQGKTDDEIKVLLKDPALNVKAGTTHLEKLMTNYSGDETLAAAAYNGGAGANLASVNCPGLLRWQCEWDSNGCHGTGRTDCTPNIGYRETRNYVQKIQNNKACP